MPNTVRFYSKMRPNRRKSEEAGRLIEDEVEMVEIILAGDKQTRPHAPAHEVTVTYDAVKKADDRRTWAERYPDEYKAFKQGTRQDISGTPLEAWGVLTRAQLAEMRALDIATVEQIADMNERNRTILGPNARLLIAQAQQYVGQLQALVKAQQPNAELDALRAELAALKAEDKPRRGRPPKAEEAAA
jgi:hypothetical protein